MKIVTSLIVFFLVLGVTVNAVETKDIQIKNFKNNKINLEGYKTYKILEESGILHDVNSSKTSKKINLDIEIRKIIHEELAKKGKVLVTSNPEFLVAYSAGSDKSTIENNTSNPLPESAMALVLIDAETGVVLHKSTAEAEAKGLPIDLLKQRIKYAIKHMINSL